MSSDGMIKGSNDSRYIGTVAANGTLSEPFDLTGFTLAGLMLDNATAGTLSFLVSPVPHQINGTLTNQYHPVLNKDGSLYQIGVPAASVAYSAEAIVAAIAPYRYARVLFTTAQVNGPTLQFLLKA